MLAEPLDFTHLRNTYWMPTVCWAPCQAPWGTVVSFSWQVPPWQGQSPEKWRQIPCGWGGGFWSKGDSVPALRELSSSRAPQGFRCKAGLPFAGWRGGGSPASPLTVDTSAQICALWFLPLSFHGLARGGLCRAEHQMTGQSLFAVWASHHSANRWSVTFVSWSFQLHLIS